MPIPDAQKLTAQIYVSGVIQAAGASSLGWISVFHYKRTNPSLPLNKGNLNIAFRSAMAASIQALLNNTWSADQIFVRMLEDITDPNQGFNIIGGGWTGGVAGDRLPPDNTLFMKVNSLLRGPQYRGRKFWSPMSESDTTSGTDDCWNAATMIRASAVITAMTTPLTDADGNTWNPVIYSRSLSSTKPVPALVVSTPISSIDARRSIGRFKKRAPSRVY